MRLADATSQTIEEELRALERYARGARLAMEIGTDQGVSAARIARSLAPDGQLNCVDPWPAADGKVHPCFSICRRHLRLRGVENRVRFIRGYSGQVAAQMPATDLDFAFIDGDHSRSGIETDWKIVSGRMRPGAVVCLHDSVVPPGEGWRRLDSCGHFEDVIRRDPRFETIEIVHSMAVLRRR